MRTLWEQYLQPTARTAKKVMAGLKTLIGTISLAKYFDGNKNAAFWFLISGAILDFLIGLIKENDN